MERDTPIAHLLVEYEIPDDESVSVAAIRAVSSLKECGPCELIPLYWTIDPDLLDELSESLQGGTVQFIYSDFHITVENGKYLVLQPTD